MRAASVSASVSAPENVGTEDLVGECARLRERVLFLEMRADLDEKRLKMLDDANAELKATLQSESTRGDAIVALRLQHHEEVVELRRAFETALAQVAANAAATVLEERLTLQAALIAAKDAHLQTLLAGSVHVPITSTPTNNNSTIGPDAPAAPSSVQDTVSTRVAAAASSPSSVGAAPVAAASPDPVEVETLQITASTAAPAEPGAAESLPQAQRPAVAPLDAKDAGAAAEALGASPATNVPPRLAGALAIDPNTYRPVQVKVVLLGGPFVGRTMILKYVQTGVVPMRPRASNSSEHAKVYFDQQRRTKFGSDAAAVTAVMNGRRVATCDVWTMPGQSAPNAVTQLAYLLRGCQISIVCLDVTRICCDGQSATNSSGGGAVSAGLSAQDQALEARLLQCAALRTANDLMNAVLHHSPDTRFAICLTKANLLRGFKPSWRSFPEASLHAPLPAGPVPSTIGPQAYTAGPHAGASTTIGNGFPKDVEARMIEFCGLQARKRGQPMPWFATSVEAQWGVEDMFQAVFCNYLAHLEGLGGDGRAEDSRFAVRLVQADPKRAPRNQNCAE